MCREVGLSGMSTTSQGSLLRCFRRDRSGGTAIEYTLICSLIFLALLAAAQEVSRQNNATFEQIEQKIIESNADNLGS